MDIKTFDRVEKKYLITEENYQVLLKSIKKQMKKDEYHKSTVFNIYFDTDNFDYIIESIEHPSFKEKLRARSYGGYDKVFLEIKTKILGHSLDPILYDEFSGRDNNLGYKRRVLITHKDFNELIAGKKSCVDLASRKVEQPTDLQIASEVDYYITTKNLKPKILVYYDRESFIGDDGLRVTFDRNLKYRDKNLKFNERARDPVYFDDDKNIIMEIKARGSIPLWLVKNLSSEHLYPQRFSKIGNIYNKLRKEKNV